MAGEKILVVDDRRENIAFLANDVLRPQGYDIITALDGERGLEKALEEKPDLIVTDMRMPKKSGAEMIRALREAGHNVPVILTTFHGSEQTAIEAFRAGATDYLIKPFTVDEMLQAVDRALTHRPAPAPSDEPKALGVQKLLEQRLAELSTLHDIVKSTISTLDVGAVLSRTIKAAVFLTNAEEGYLMLTEPPTGELYLRMAWNHGDKHARSLHLKVNDSLTHQVLSTGKPVIFKPPSSGAAGHKLKTGYLIKSLLAVPVKKEKTIIGVLSVGNVINRVAFTDDDSRQLCILGEYVGIAIENAQLYRRAQDQIQAVVKEAARLKGAGIAQCHFQAARLADQLRVLSDEAKELAQRLQPPPSDEDDPD